MKKIIALVSTFLAIGFHGYLSLHFYELNYGLSAGDSICNLSAQFNCDTVTASSFSSFLEAPLALWGLVTNAILALLLGGWYLGWTDNSSRLGRYSLWLSGFIALMSIAMGTISTFLIGSYCLFCIGSYLASFLTFGLIFKEQEPTTATHTDHFMELFSKAKFYAFYILAIPLVTLVTHKAYVQKIGAQNLSALIKSSVSEWIATPAADFSGAQPMIVKGDEAAEMILAEFADFTCGHCKNAAPSINAFSSSRSGVQVHFYVFPLDSTCNEAIPSGGNGVSCFLAKSVFCAEKVSQKGWAMHDYIFSVQDELNSQRSLEFTKSKVSGALSALEISLEEQSQCLSSDETESAIRNQAKLGKSVGVNGTPAFFVNGKKLSRGQLLPVLEAVYDETTKMEP